MKKALVIIVILLLIVAGGVYYFLTNLDVLVKAAIEKYGSEVTQTAVRVDRVKIDLRQGAGGIYGLTVANPKGFDTKQAFALGETSIKINLKSLGEDVIVIDAITVRAPKVMYEMNAEREGSLNNLYDNISKSIPAGGKAGKEEADAGPKLIIRKLVFEDGAIDARLVPLDNKTYSVKLPKLNMANLGAPNGATGSALAKEILGRITKAAQEEVKRQVVDKQLKSAVEAERKKLEGEAQKRIEEETKKLDPRLQDLLKR
ncbi:MAG: hypothetical protein AMJ68_06650 [Acidithiobacillales bacterium SG8_45]|nr:MAG: hypothetical protein AMJ68_06650 [Acidithiobacillales bacterium SG8_45]